MSDTSKEKKGQQMSMWRLKNLFAPFAACVLLLQAYGCQDLPKADDDSIKSAHVTLANFSDDSKHKAHRAQPAEAAKKKEAPDGATRGACSQSDRTDYVHDANRKFVSQMRTCSKDTWANNAKNFNCLTKNMPSLSKGCARCFADMASCAKDNCKMACMLDAKSDKCIDCANSNCQASLIQCTGVARADLP